LAIGFIKLYNVLNPYFRRQKMLLLGFSSLHELRNIESIWYTTDGITYPEA
jgi:hypothetical protein